MNSVIWTTIIAIGLAALDVIADACLKEAGIGKGAFDLRWFALGAFLYALTVVGWLFVLREMKLSTVGVVYGVSCVLFLALAGFLFFGEHLKPMEWLGMGMAIASIMILARFA